jgi:hypothetical protein
VISAEGELQASEKLAQAAARMEATPTALQLRLLETNARARMVVQPRAAASVH